ncbi:hypothetical protein [Planctomycetes bacterium K23_9]|uniref:Uncharacterized protein n=1 Tax=Stieleria marina TaxID=1930275 RepID=A0A517NNQ1_9BACT|nr:hypothetical protein K239x_06920 [Planctomycetes bacterium K23_9]
MRKFATTGALCAIVMSASLVSAKDDFSALLSELSYNQPAASSPSYRVADNSQAAATATTPAPASAQATVSHQPAISMPAGQSQPMHAQQFNHAGPAPASFQQPCDSGCASTGGGCLNGSCRSGNCESGFCTPHNMPNLPGSTLRQYWRSNACNSNVWDGYQNECRKPLFGKKRCGQEEGCATEGCATEGWVPPPSQAPCDTQVSCDVPSYVEAPTASCDSGSCDANGWAF